MKSEAIRAALDRIETEENARIVYACESGSRAWGFASADSDYDVRFLYVRPLEWYLSVDERRDVIEQPIQDELDISGWDLRKALRLFRKSNPPLLEWLGSPIVYRERGVVTARLRELARDHHSPAACLYHYLQMAHKTHATYLQGGEVQHKKYFYALRPLLAMRWIEQGRGMAPTNFCALLESLALEPELRTAIEHLMAEKRAGTELAAGSPIPALSGFIERELERWQRQGIAAHQSSSLDETLDELFRESLREAWR